MAKLPAWPRWKCPECSFETTAPEKAMVDQAAQWHVEQYHESRKNFREKVRQGMQKKKESQKRTRK